MDIFRERWSHFFTAIAYLVTIYEVGKIIWHSYKYGRLRKLQTIRIQIATRLLPRYLQDKLLRFSEDDIDIQIKKLHGNRKFEQINALKHLEQILKFIPTESTNRQDFENIQRIQRAIFKVLWHTKTDSDVVKKAVDMLCGNNHLRFECGCNE